MHHLVNLLNIQQIQRSSTTYLEFRNFKNIRKRYVICDIFSESKFVLHVSQRKVQVQDVSLKFVS